jgi:hypothetical protein
VNGETNSQDGGVSYPYCPLSLCLPVADAVRSLGGGKATVSKSLIAASLKEDERSQTLQFKIGAARVFGIIEGRSKIQLTEIGKKYYFPTTSTERQAALVSFLENPRAFAFIIQRFDGSKVPDMENLGNILHREAAVPESWKGRVATFFIKSAQLAGVIDTENHLRVRATREGQLAKEPVKREGDGMNADEAITLIAPASIETEHQMPEVPKYKRVPGNLNVASDTFMVTRSDDNGQQKTIYAEVPKEMNLHLWNLLNSWVQSLKPGKK